MNFQKYTYISLSAGNTFIWTCLFYSSGLAEAADNALKALKGMRAGIKADGVIRNRKRIKSEMSSLFNHQKKQKLGKFAAWRHKFVCLAFFGQDRTPTTDAHREELYQAGLGEKEIVFESLDISQEEFKDLIYTQFPRLRDGGGFQLLKCLPNSRNLEVLSMAAHASISLLKLRVGKSRTYIRPIQQDLDLSPLEDPPSGVSQLEDTIR